MVEPKFLSQAEIAALPDIGHTYTDKLRLHQHCLAIIASLYSVARLLIEANQPHDALIIVQAAKILEQVYPDEP